ncbi:MAG TPA: methylmalonyl Co-A mutase-associated GTPase MeaB [Dongiaceae bacterium]
MDSLEALGAGGKPAIAAALAALEREPEAPATLRQLDAAYALPLAHVIGLTGPPGVGKSTLAGALIRSYRASAKRIAVIAVDPSSRRSGGALLGDRTRLQHDPEDPGVFVRSMAARDRLGGLAELSIAAMVLLRALYDVVVLETVGVGQSETDVADSADTVVFCVQPGSGDSLQFMKAGIVEIPHLVVVTKADMGAAAKRARADVEGALGLAEAGDWPVEVLSLAALRGEGVEPLIGALERRWAWLAEAGRLPRQRQDQARQWVVEGIRQRFGREGLKRAGEIALQPGESPFARLADIGQRIQARGR